jgi:hypothetical protein
VPLLLKAIEARSMTSPTAKPLMTRPDGIEVPPICRVVGFAKMMPAPAAPEDSTSRPPSTIVVPPSAPPDDTSSVPPPKTIEPLAKLPEETSCVPPDRIVVPMAVPPKERISFPPLLMIVPLSRLGMIVAVTRPPSTSAVPPLLMAVPIAVPPLMTTCDPVKMVTPLARPKSIWVPPEIRAPRSVPPRSSTVSEPPLSIVVDVAVPKRASFPKTTISPPLLMIVPTADP